MENCDNLGSDKLIAYPKRQNLTAIMLICGIVTLTSIVSFLSNHYIAGTLLGLFFCFLIWMIAKFPWKEAFKPKLIIDFKGIWFSNVLITNWNDLRIIEINAYHDSDGIRRKKLIIDRHEVELDDLELDRYDLERIIKKYRTKNNSRQ